MLFSITVFSIELCTKLQDSPQLLNRVSILQDSPLLLNRASILQDSPQLLNPQLNFPKVVFQIVPNHVVQYEPLGNVAVSLDENLNFLIQGNVRFP